ncbi:MAG: insulinase family protein [Pyrinomonadaceae bacterium]
MRAPFTVNHPAGIVSPPLDSLKKTTSADLARFHSTHYLPNNAILAVVGQVTLKSATCWQNTERSNHLIPKVNR